MRFDREAPGGGLDIFSFVENGKAEIFFTVYLAAKQKATGQMCDTGSPAVEITMHDEDGRQTACLWIPAGRESREYQDDDSQDDDSQGMSAWSVSSRTLLIYPRLWQGTEAPCLYAVKATLICGGQETDMLQLSFPVCSMRCIPGGGFFLNEKEYPLRAVHYPVSQRWHQELEQDLETLTELGANCICPDRFVKEQGFYELCLKKGMIVWKESDAPVHKEIEKTEQRSEIPLFCGEQGALLQPDRRRRNDLFYYYQACWSSRKVLHICRSKLKPGRGQPVSVLVYSNQKKVALYADGILQEFKQSPPCFLFEDIVLNRENTVISAQAGECFTSVTV